MSRRLNFLEPSFEPADVDERTFLDVLGEVHGNFAGARISYGVIGGVASATYGRPRHTNDIDVLIRSDDSVRALDVLSGAAFATQRTDPERLWKAAKRGVVVEVALCTRGDIYLDDVMRARLRQTFFRGVPICAVPPEDLVVMKAIAHEEPSARHWHDALAVIAEARLDWDYLIRRASHGARRVLSLLLYAQSVDLVVPQRVIRGLFSYVDHREDA
ncbi:MAG TPA: nucleotidyltransferase [Actinomycetota bacterium]|nr:nucleotidyltransferase [Actinomycetota bacterium]